MQIKKLKQQVFLIKFFYFHSKFGFMGYGLCRYDITVSMQDLHSSGRIL